MDFTGYVVIITGASSGIGRQIAIQFSRDHAKVTLVGRNLENLQETSNLCNRQCPGNTEDVLIIQADVTHEGETKRIIDETIDRFGKIDILVNNVGILNIGTMEMASMQQYDDIMNTNIRSIFEITKLAIPHLLKTKGNVVMMSSINGMRSFPGSICYSLSKSALDQMVRCLSLELGKQGVRVNGVNPGFIDTDITRYIWINDEQKQKYLENSKSTIPIGRIGTVAEVANCVQFLTSHLADNINGIQMICDGGRHNMCAM